MQSMPQTVSRGAAVLLSLSVLACASAPALPAQASSRATSSASQPPLPGAQADTLDPNWVPTGFGSLRQDDIALKVSPSGGVQVRAVPLDERFIRLLSPDSYRSLHELSESKRMALIGIRDRTRLQSYSVWYVSFFALEQGETRFSPQEFVISNTGRDFRPLDVVPLTPGFGEYRLKQREVQSALLVFDGQIDLNQPITAQMENSQTITDWNQVLQRIERERALVRSRASAVKKGG